MFVIAICFHPLCVCALGWTEKTCDRLTRCVRVTVGVRQAVVTNTWLQFYNNHKVSNRNK